MKKGNALILGGTSDIGVSTIKTLKKYFQIYFTYYSNASRARRLPGIRYQCDVTNIAQVAEVFQKVPSLDLMVTAAFPYTPTNSLDYHGYREVEPYLRGHVAAICLASEKMKSGGKIINLLGQSAIYGMPGGAHYSASFAYLKILGDVINAEHGRKGKISVHNILLGPVDTKIWKNVSNSVIKKYRRRVQRFMSPQEVAEIIKQIALSEIGPTQLIYDAFYSLPLL